MGFSSAGNAKLEAAISCVTTSVSSTLTYSSPVSATIAIGTTSSANYYVSITLTSLTNCAPGYFGKLRLQKLTSGATWSGTYLRLFEPTIMVGVN